MFFAKWFAPRRTPSKGNSRPRQSFRPSLSLLEDRNSPNGFGPGWMDGPLGPDPSAGGGPHQCSDGGGSQGGGYHGAAVSALAATQFYVDVPGNITPGVPTYVTVVALDTNGDPTSNYTGTVNLSTTDAKSNLPSTYTFTASDQGQHTFQVAFQTPGTQTVTATDSATSSITGDASTFVDTVGPVTHFGLHVKGRAGVGGTTTVIVSALDAEGKVVAGYTGTVQLSSSDSAAKLPAAYTFTSADAGSHSFTVNFNTKGRDTLTATDTTTSSLTGSTRVLVGATVSHVSHPHR
jgi:hypothetical protein